VSCHERGALGLTDEAQLQLATDEDRALLTFNYVDFIRIAAEWWRIGRGHAGVIVSYRQYRRAELAQLSRSVAALLDATDAASLRDSVVALDNFRA
jgi:hypothetical protein